MTILCNEFRVRDIRNNCWLKPDEITIDKLNNPEFVACRYLPIHDDNGIQYCVGDVTENKSGIRCEIYFDDKKCQYLGRVIQNDQEPVVPDQWGNVIGNKFDNPSLIDANALNTAEFLDDIKALIQKHSALEVLFDYISFYSDQGRVSLKGLDKDILGFSSDQLMNMTYSVRTIRNEKMTTKGPRGNYQFRLIKTLSGEKAQELSEKYLNNGFLGGEYQDLAWRFFYQNVPVEDQKYFIMTQVRGK